MSVELMFHETLRVYYERKELIRKVFFEDCILPLNLMIDRLFFFYWITYMCMTLLIIDT